MSAARDEMLARIRTALRSAPPDEVAIPHEYRRLGRRQPGSAELLALLEDRLVDYRATVHRSTSDRLPATLASIMEACGRVVVPAGLARGWAPTGAVTDDGSLSMAELDAIDTVLTACAAAAAVTGTIVLDASPDQGRRASTLLPDRHVCVVRAGQVVETIPELLARLDPTRPLTFISGPSATSDIELQRVEGVHGPRTLVVLLCTDEAR